MLEVCQDSLIYSTEWVSREGERGEGLDDYGSLSEPAGLRHPLEVNEGPPLAVGLSLEEGHAPWSSRQQMEQLSRIEAPASPS